MTAVFSRGIGPVFNAGTCDGVSGRIHRGNHAQRSRRFSGTLMKRPASTRQRRALRGPLPDPVAAGRGDTAPNTEDSAEKAYVRGDPEMNKRLLLAYAILSEATGCLGAEPGWLAFRETRMRGKFQPDRVRRPGSRGRGGNRSAVDRARNVRHGRHHRLPRAERSSCSAPPDRSSTYRAGPSRFL